MAKSVTTDKRENEKKKLARRAEKQKRKEEKKLAPKVNSLDDMIAYVDENGMITSTPPEESVKREEIKQEDIMIATPKKEKEAPTIMRGRIEFFNTSKGFGFIKDLSGTEKYFFCTHNYNSKIFHFPIIKFPVSLQGERLLHSYLSCHVPDQTLQYHFRKYRPSC